MDETYALRRVVTNRVTGREEFYRTRDKAFAVATERQVGDDRGGFASRYQDIPKRAICRSVTATRCLLDGYS